MGRTLVGLAPGASDALDHLAHAILVEALLADQKSHQAVLIRRLPLHGRDLVLPHDLWFCGAATAPSRFKTTYTVSLRCSANILMQVNELYHKQMERMCPASMRAPVAQV